jgi:hypothetical protein
MKYLILIPMLVSCAHYKQTPRKEEDLVTVQTALMQAQASYLKGCVDAMKELKIPVAFHGCRDKSIIHRQELNSIMDVQN